jgi:hypothetical protein
LYRIDDLEACNVDSELLGLSSEINGRVDVLGPDEWGVCYYNNRGFCNTPITKERISHHKMALGGVFPSEDPSKRQEFFDAGDGIVAVKWKVGVDGENHVMCECTRFWKSTVCQHAYHFKYGDPALSNTKRARISGPKRTLKFGGREEYVRGQPSEGGSGFDK